MTAKDLTEANRDNRDGNRNLRFLRLLATCRSYLPWPAEAERAKAAVRNLKTKSMKITTMEMKTKMVLAGFSFALGAALALPTEAQDVLPRPEQPFKGKIGRTAADSTPDFPKDIHAPKGAPNVLLIMTDDVGWGASSTFGGPIPTPAYDKLAASGLRYNTFHTTALCSPTRAALITGRNHHTASTGVIGEAATGYDGYTSVLPRSTGTVGEVLRQNGYMTAWIGKNHNTPPWEASAAGPFDHWANGLGFDYFCGFNGGDMNHWNPVLFENRNLVPASTDPDYYLTTDLADHAISWVRRVKTIAP